MVSKLASAGLGIAAIFIVGAVLLLFAAGEEFSFEQEVLNIRTLAAEENVDIEDLSTAEKAQLFSFKSELASEAERIEAFPESVDSKAALLLIEILNSKIRLELKSRGLGEIASELSVSDNFEDGDTCVLLPKMNETVTAMGEAYAIAIDLSESINEYRSLYPEANELFFVPSIRVEKQSMANAYFSGIVLVEETEVGCGA